MTAADKVVAIRVVSKMTLEKELNETEKTATIQGYATAAGVPKENVELTKDARRQNKVTYSITVYVKDRATAAAVSNKLSDPAVLEAALTSVVLYRSPTPLCLCVCAHPSTLTPPLFLSPPAGCASKIFSCPAFSRTYIACTRWLLWRIL